MDIEYYIDHYYKKHIYKNLTEEELKVMKEFTHFCSIDINTYLLYQKISKELDEKSILKNIEILNKLIKLCSLPKPVNVYHGGAGERYDIFKKGLKLYTTKSYMSTSLDFEIADVFRFGYNESFIIDISLPKGYPALWMGDLSLHKEEHELLLMPGSTFEITNIDEMKKNKKEKYLLLTAKPII